MISITEKYESLLNMFLFAFLILIWVYYWSIIESNSQFIYKIKK